MIVALFTQSLISNEFEHIFYLTRKYDITLRKIAHKFFAALLESIVEEPHYAEIKMHLLYDYVGEVD